MKSINYKYLNVLLLLGIAYLLFLMKDVWLGVVTKIFNIALPFIISFGSAYVLYPFLNFLVKKGFPKWLSILIIILSLLLIVGLTSYFVLPVFIEQLINLLSNLTKVTGDLGAKYGIDMNIINNYISHFSSILLQNVGEFISSGNIIKVLSSGVDVITKLIIIFIVTIYFLSDMPKIRLKIKGFVRKKDKKKYELVKNIDTEVYSYLKGLGIFMIIQFFEYTFLFLIIGHPNFLLIGILACITTVIPYFGGIITNLIALVIASVVSPKVFILTLLITIIFPNIDGYVISPKIYGKTNELPAVLTVFVVFTGGALFGFTGIVIAVPLTIILMSIIKAYKPEIENSIKKIKKQNKI